MSSELKDVLESALSLLPEQEVQGALSGILQSFDDTEAREETTYYWADFDLDRRFVTGGITDLVRQVTRITTNSQEFAEISALIRLVDSDLIGAGSFLWDPAHGRMNWLLPLAPAHDTAGGGAVLRCLSISFAVFRNLFDRFNADAGLSPSEKRVVFQIVAGIDLRQAAEEDGVSYETKRMHAKNASQKLQCGGQKDILRKVLGQIVHLLMLTDAETANIDTAEAYVSRYLANDARLSVHRLGDGRLLRVLECGPSDGKAVIMIHGMMFPVTIRGLSRHLHDAGIRLIIPIRPGFLDSTTATPLVSADDLIERSILDIASFIRKSDLRPARILGLSLGTTVAMRFAEDYPDLVSHLVLMSTNLTRTDEKQNGQAGRFYSAMRELAGTPEIFALMNRRYTQYYADRKTCRQMLVRLFGASGTDIDVLDGKYSKTPAYQMFADFYRDSTVGITADFVFTMHLWKKTAKRLRLPVTVVHGAEDPLTAIDELDPILSGAGDYERFIVKDGGHFISVSHAPEVWSHIGRMF